ncbi:MAG: hypothetical protein ACJAWL_001122 [Motiliproteus sp.]
MPQRGRYPGLLIQQGVCMEEEIISVKSVVLSLACMLSGIGGAVLYYSKVGVTEDFIKYFWFYIGFCVFYSFFSKWLYHNSLYKFFSAIVQGVAIFMVFVYLFNILDN